MDEGIEVRNSGEETVPGATKAIVKYAESKCWGKRLNLISAPARSALGPGTWFPELDADKRREFNPKGLSVLPLFCFMPYGPGCIRSIGSLHACAWA